jgi:AcrR family transcriptional regulator
MTAKKAEPRRDRRVARTHRLLREALLSLAKERGWDEVTVQDVCERADVGRSTFYLHFADKEELLVSGFDDLRKEMRERAAARGGPMGFTLALLEHTTQYEWVLRALTGTRTAQVVQHEFMNVVIDLIEEDLAQHVPPGELRAAGARYLAGAFYELLRWWGGWGDRKKRAPAVEIDDVFRTLTAPVLHELVRSAREAKKR